MDITFAEFLTWVIAGGGSIVAANFFLGKLKWFRNLVFDTQQIVLYGVASVLGIGAKLLMTYAPSFIGVAEPYFIILAATFISIFVSNSFRAVNAKVRNTILEEE